MQAFRARLALVAGYNKLRMKRVLRASRRSMEAI
jgi:hypothetical protein